MTTAWWLGALTGFCVGMLVTATAFVAGRETVSSDRRWKKRGGHSCGDVAMGELPPPPEWVMQRTVEPPKSEESATDRMVVWLREAMDAARTDAEAALGRWVDVSLPFSTVAHAERYSPAAVLRQIGRHRKLLDLHTTPHTVVELVVEPVGELFCGECDGLCTHRGEAECALCGQDGCDTVRLLAGGYGWTEGTV